MVLVLRTRTGKNGGGYHVRLGLALGASEPCYGAEDDDEDDADEEAPAKKGWVLVCVRIYEEEKRSPRTRLPF
jgi:hypothetical protein